MAERGFDREISLGGILGFTLTIVLLMAGMFYLSWWLSGGLERHLASQDPPPSPLAAANVVQLPPEPRLQTRPEVDMAALREEEEAVLGSYGWVDADRGLVRIPIDEALDWVATHGVPTFETVTPPATGAEDSGR